MPLINGSAKITWQFMLGFVVLVAAYFVLRMNDFDKTISTIGFVVLFVGLMMTTLGKKKE